MNNRGFTLLEMLVVLIIISLIFFITSFNYFKVSDSSSLTTEAKILGEAYESMQMKSLTTNKESKVKITSDGFICYLGSEEIYRHKFYNELDVNTNFSDNTISITDDGRVKKGGTINLKRKEEEIKIIISISHGRYRIEK